MFRNSSSFVATESSGRQHRLIIQTDEVEAADLTSGPETLPGIRRIRTADGRSVNKIGPGQYQIIGGMEPIEVTSTDPIAP